ncbi:MAG: hypothetical protein ABL867_04750 [Rickettsiales bacterium]
MSRKDELESQEPQHTTDDSVELMEELRTKAGQPSVGGYTGDEHRRRTQRILNNTRGK